MAQVVLHGVRVVEVGVQVRMHEDRGEEEDGDEGPVSGVAQVVSHEVKVVGVHGEEGKEKDGEVQVEVKGEVDQLREKRSSWMIWDDGDGLKDDLSQCGCDMCEKHEH